CTYFTRTILHNYRGAGTSLGAVDTSPLISCTRNGSSARGQMLVSRRGASLFPQSWRRKSPGNVRSSRPAGAGPVLDVVRKHLDDAKRGNPRIDRGFRGTHREDRANGPRRSASGSRDPARKHDGRPGGTLLELADGGGFSPAYSCRT